VPVHVSSEIGRLRTVLVHAPGPELLAVTPRTREHFLYDDIIDFETAQREHRRFVAILERFATVYRVRDLLADVAGSAEVRELLIRETTNVVPSAPLARELADLAPEALVRTLIEGREERPGPLAAALNECGYALPPMPNLFFTRDAAMAINDHVMVGSMRHGARWTEELIMKILFQSHPALANCGVLYDGSSERRHDYTLEGGDVHPLRRDTVAIGYSERSSPAAIDSLVALLFRHTAIENVIVVVMPAEQTAIHLDMIFCHFDRELCVLYPPHFIGPERLPILLWRKGAADLQQKANIFDAFSACGIPMEPVLCGGSRRVVQDREQWASGCNCLALRPGLVVSYARNEATLREMERMGYRIVAAADFLNGASIVGDDERAVIAVEGSELVRGGGGPRCMSCPVTRDDPWT
jgi:arginine deiminase